MKTGERNYATGFLGEMGRCPANLDIGDTHPPPRDQLPLSSSEPANLAPKHGINSGQFQVLAALRVESPGIGRLAPQDIHSLAFAVTAIIEL